MFLGPVPEKTSELVRRDPEFARIVSGRGEHAAGFDRLFPKCLNDLAVSGVSSHLIESCGALNPRDAGIRMIGAERVCSCKELAKHLRHGVSGSQREKPGVFRSAVEVSPKFEHP